ncbi:hypothetical protein ACIQAC_23535 [Streptomyces sp. NPDC088387]|uniref:hypothetical protein n=1 Tax=Streptomyces sp. NPDC088387 TaxID=3365859 RepID=UPI00381855AD
MDDGIRADLEQWYEQARLVRTGDGEVHNTVSGGTQSGPVIQGRDFHGISFNGPLPTPTEQPGGNAPPPQG